MYMYGRSAILNLIGIPHAYSSHFRRKTALNIHNNYIISQLTLS